MLKKKNLMQFKNRSFFYKTKIKNIFKYKKKAMKNNSSIFLRIFQHLSLKNSLRFLKLKRKKKVLSEVRTDFYLILKILLRNNIKSLNRLKLRKNRILFSKEQLVLAQLFFKFKHNKQKVNYVSNKQWELDSKPTQFQNWNSWWQNNDFIYNQFTINKLINTLVTDGKRWRAENIFYSSLISLKKLGVSYKPYSLILLKMIELRPLVSFYSKRRGKKIVMVPMPTVLTKSGKTFIKWFHNSIQERHESKIKDRLLGELIDLLYSNNSKITNYKKQLFLTAIENRAFTHFRWGKTKSGLK